MSQALIICYKFHSDCWCGHYDRVMRSKWAVNICQYYADVIYLLWWCHNIRRIEHQQIDAVMQTTLQWLHLILTTSTVNTQTTVCLHHCVASKKRGNSNSVQWQQDAQLSQRDRAAGCVIVFAKSRRRTGRQYFTDSIGLSSTTVMKLAWKSVEFREKMQNKGYYGVKGHSRSSRSVPIESPYAICY